MTVLWLYCYSCGVAVVVVVSVSVKGRLLPPPQQATAIRHRAPSSMTTLVPDMVRTSPQCSVYTGQLPSSTLAPLHTRFSQPFAIPQPLSTTTWH